MKIEIRTDALDPWSEIDRYQRAATAMAGRFGATAVFVGTMRDFNEGAPVRGMFLEHYPGMTETHLQRIAASAAERWPLDDLLLLHRVGRVEPGDAIVLVAVWSAHRKAAFEACRYIMEDLKSKAPFWKKEDLPEAQRWVGRNTPG